MSGTEKLFGIQTIYGAEGGHETPYMTRAWIGRLRLHIFHRGDADPDPHDHPWDFWTFPLTSYVEEVTVVHGYAQSGQPNTVTLVAETTLEVVTALRLHHRQAEHTHRVIGRVRRRHDASSPDAWEDIPGKIITLVWRGKTRRAWGFLKNRDGCWCWDAWRDYVFNGGKHAPCEPEEGQGRD